MITILRILMIFFFITIASCKKEPPPQRIFQFHDTVIKPEDIKTITPYEAKTYHVDKKYKYEYRTGISGHYEYNYDVNGTDATGSKVTGTINIEGELGAGFITNQKGEELEVQVVWIGYGKLKATDVNGKEYELVVHE
jgi:hypothetical protein